ncbi:hypothetical protein M231_07708 [Tremella mesenterica]|uniref:Uncharacterized protein n=1 Tax=Tremella mesenterica TaxID=5217 RepID=A0A4V1M2Y9_TREME|nr:uncharacterized protein TREMEDRAFT_64112 [Tremella mesenterica DSM 1558]EIW67526.1 hypothetical protein TREMEDRAFT_64112 [Tremella mesenterica DSM 1558]RXK35030.1 hypothetical protein M231_07708 [Tremella mesenterica]
MSASSKTLQTPIWCDNDGLGVEKSHHDSYDTINWTLDSLNKEEQVDRPWKCPAWPSTTSLIFGATEETHDPGEEGRVDQITQDIHSSDYGVLDFGTFEQNAFSSNIPGIRFHHVPNGFTGTPGEDVLVLTSHIVASGWGDPCFRSDIQLLYCPQSDSKSPHNLSHVETTCMRILGEVMFSRHYSLKRVGEEISLYFPRLRCTVVTTLELQKTLYNGRGRLILEDSSLKLVSVDSPEYQSGFDESDTESTLVNDGCDGDLFFFSNCSEKLFLNKTPGVSCRMIPDVFDSESETLRSVIVITGRWIPQDEQSMMTGRVVSNCLRTKGWSKFRQSQIASCIQRKYGASRSQLQLEINYFPSMIDSEFKPEILKTIQQFIQSTIRVDALEGWEPDDISHTLAARLQKELNRETTSTNVEDLVLSVNWNEMREAVKKKRCSIINGAIVLTRGDDGLDSIDGMSEASDMDI